MPLLLGVSSLALAVWFRWRVWIQRKGEGVDHHYWIQVAEAYKVSRKLPVNLGSRYLLEEADQFYPPGFCVFLSRLPLRFVKSRESVLIPQALDLLAASCVGAFTWWEAGDLRASLFASAIYLLAPALIVYNTQLVSRPLGNLFLVLALLTQFVCWELNGPWAALWWLMSSLSIAFVVLTHKMTTQFLVFLVPVFVFCAPSVIYKVGVVAGFALSLFIARLLVGRDFFVMQWKAHFDVVSFWNRNWRHLGAHQLLNSPIYGSSEFEATSIFHKKGLGGVREHVLRIFGFLPGVVPVLAMSIFVGDVPAVMLWWLTVACAAALATTLLAPLKCLGGGHLYMFNAVAPLSFLVGHVAVEDFRGSEILFLVVAAVNVAVLVLVLRRARGPMSDSDTQDRCELMDLLVSDNAARVAVLPCTAAEEIANGVGCSVMWGGHSLGFRQLEPYWPVLRRSLSTFVREFDLDHVVLDRDWAGAAAVQIESELGVRPKVVGRWGVYKIR